MGDKNNRRWTGGINMITRTSQKDRILVLMGGFSAEREVSIRSGKECSMALESLGYNVSTLDPGYDIINDLLEINPDIVFNCLHGSWGEDGHIQSILETTGIPYTHSGVISSAIAMDKVLSKKIFSANNILTPKYLLYSFDKSKSYLIKLIEKKLKFPVVIKPINEGSSVNVFICNKFNIINKLKLLEDYKKIIIEEFIPGREIQVAIMSKKILGAIELKPKRKFYDYEAKYNPKAKTQHIIPVELNSKNLKKITNIALKAHKVIGCRSITRSDFKFYKGKFYLLEINTQPGMTKLSLVPEISAFKNINFINLLKLIIKDAETNK